MSKDLLIVDHNPHRPVELAPIASEAGFVECWLPLSTLYDLEWLPQFEWGVELSKDEVPSVIQEFIRLKELLLTNPPQNLPHHTIEAMVGNIDGVIMTLRAAQGDQDVRCCFIG